MSPAFRQDLWAAEWFVNRGQQHLANRATCLDTEDPCGAVVEYLLARDCLRLAKHNLTRAEVSAGKQIASPRARRVKFHPVEEDAP